MFSVMFSLTEEMFISSNTGTKNMSRANDLRVLEAVLKELSATSRLAEGRTFDVVGMAVLLTSPRRRGAQGFPHCLLSYKLWQLPGGRVSSSFSTVKRNLNYGSDSVGLSTPGLNHQMSSSQHRKCVGSLNDTGTYVSFTLCLGRLAVR